MKNVRSSQPCISMNFVLNPAKHKFLFHVNIVNWPNFIVWLLLHFEILANMSIIIICFPDCDVINFEINLSFFKKNRTQSSEQKELLRLNKKHFPSFLNGFQFSEMVAQTWEWAFTFQVKFEGDPLSGRQRPW